jgi:hypothetical protein
MIPAFDQYGNLPPGIHWATWEEIVHRYGTNERRNWLLAGLREALLALQRACCRTVYLNGSFVTANDCPGDFDACWEIEGISLKLLDPILLDFSEMRLAQKKKYAGELFPLLPPNVKKGHILRDFQRDKTTGRTKGIIAINLDTFE